MALKGLAGECGHQTDELLLFSPEGAQALLANLAASIDTPPATKLAKATTYFHSCARGSSTVSAYVVRFRTAAARFMTCGNPLPDRILGGILLRTSGLSHAEQSMVKMGASTVAVSKAFPAVAELAASMERLHGHLPPPPVAGETINITAAEHLALLAVAAERGPLICRHCHKKGQVPCHWPDSQLPGGAARPPTLRLPGDAPPAAARPAAARPGAVPR